LCAVQDADVQCGLLVAQAIERRSATFGLNAPAPMMRLQILEMLGSEADNRADDRLPRCSRSREGWFAVSKTALTAGAGEGNRTLDIQLGKLSFYH
jgi:hypothetical protein